MNPASGLSVICAMMALACSAPHGGVSRAPDAHRQSRIHLKRADNPSTPASQRVALYLASASEAAALLGSPETAVAAATTYNQAAAELTVLLRSADHGNLWNRPLTFTADGSTYRLRYAPGNREGGWDPACFTSFTTAAGVPKKSLYRRNTRDGLGGTLVGIHHTDPPERFSPLVGVTAPVTAVLNFSGQDATLSLVDPDRKDELRVQGAPRVLAADFSAPLAYYPRRNQRWEGVMGAIRVTSYMKTTGLYMLQPYDPRRIPLIFVHGLISTPEMWRNVINEIGTDPALRDRYQCWVFSYPTGNPPAYSALRLREELAKLYQSYPGARDCVIVSHSLGGLLTQMQVTTVDRDAWNGIGREKAASLFKDLEKGSLIERCVAFDANPHVGRAVFICTPHRGSELAISGLGDLGVRLINLPLSLTATIAGSLGNSLAFITGDPKRMPSSVTGLSPANPMLKVLNSRPIEVPYHSIIGDRGKGDTPDSSDGVVEYWSSHLDNAESEKIVPGPHGLCQLPESITELRRILHLHLREAGEAR